MDCRDCDILERAVHAITEQAANTNKVIDGAMEAGLAPDHPSRSRPNRAPMHDERDPAPAEVYEVWASIRTLHANGDLYD